MNTEPEKIMTDETIPEKKKRAYKRRTVTESAINHEIPEAVEVPEEKPKKPRASKKQKLSAPKLARQIQGVHLIAATFAGPEFAIDEQEAEALSTAIVNLAEEYDIVPTGKTAAWVGMLTACAMVYGPRIPAIMNLVKQNRKSSAQVHHLQATSPSAGHATSEG